MKKAFILSLLVLMVSGVKANKLPWANIAEGNAYWSHILGVQAQAPRAKTVAEIVNANVLPDESVQLINAALRYQINQLPNNDMVRFADSLMHVIIYVSGGAPRKADLYDRAGWWNLSYPVAMRYGLKVNQEVDERYNFEKSTRVAMRYAKDLQRNFTTPNEWLHAFIEDPLAITRPQSKFGTDSLMKALFAIYKVMVISDYTTAEEYAVQHFYGSVENWQCKEQLLTALVIESTGIQEQVFYALNPEVRGSIIPPKHDIFLTSLALASLKKQEEDVVLLSNARLEESAEKIASARNRINRNQPDPRTTETTVYRVRSGDNLGAIAGRFGVKVSDLKSWNSLRNDMIYAGQRLTVYGQKRAPAAVSTTASKAKPEPKPAEPMRLAEGEFIQYKVKNGDTLWSIAKRFPGVSPDNIMAWNGINSSIKVGQEIKILKKEIRDYSPNRYPDSL